MPATSQFISSLPPSPSHRRLSCHYKPATATVSPKPTAAEQSPQQNHATRDHGHQRPAHERPEASRPNQSSELAAHPKPSQSPQSYRPRLIHLVRSNHLGIGPPPPFHRPDAGRNRAEFTKRELPRAARLEQQHRPITQKRLHVELPHQGQQPASSKQRARGVAVAWLVITP